MTFAQTLDRFLTLTRELWSSQAGWILLLSALTGLLYLLPDSASVPLGLVVVLVLATLTVFWVKVAAAEGRLDAGAFEGKAPDWLGYLGVVLGMFTVFVGLAVVVLVPVLILPFFVIVAAFLWLGLALLLVLYEPAIYVGASGFSDALEKTWALLRRFEQRGALLEARFWYPLLLGPVVVVPQFFLPAHGLAAAISNFLVALVQIPWFVAQLVVLYENIWREREGPAEPSG